MNERQSRRAPEARKPSSLMKIYPKMGHLGNRKMRRLSIFPGPLAAAAVGLSCILAGCSSSGQAFYIGTLKPQAGTCDPPGSATLEIRNDAILFVPTDGTVILHGSVSTGGALHAEATLPGMDHKPYQLVFSAPSAQIGTVEGQYVTPRCTYVITLRKTQA